jgi:glycine amidinotransferase
MTTLANATDPTTVGPVRSYTEWDPLEEVIVGRLAGGVFPTWQESMAATMPEGSWQVFRERGGTPLPAELLDRAEDELAGLVDVLVDRGITVTRPDKLDYRAGFATPDWSVPGGLYAGMPRDHLIVVGDTIVEAPLSWRCRYYEGDAYRDLLKGYFRAGAKWLQAPRPQLTDELFKSMDQAGDPGGFAVTEHEPVFDAADFLRFGRDLVVQHSHVTNDFGIEWLRRAVGDEFTVHVIEVNDPHAMHIDATLMPLAPGRLLVNPERYVPSPLFADWELIEAPRSTLPGDWPMYFCSPWVNMNLLSLDERTVVVESHEQPLIDELNRRGFDCVPVDFRHVYSFGGSFHCVTTDIRRDADNGQYLG